MIDRPKSLGEAWRLLIQMEERIAELESRIEKRNETDGAIGGWLSAALDDPDVCAEMKLDIVAWFTEQPDND